MVVVVVAVYPFGISSGGGGGWCCLVRDGDGETSDVGNMWSGPWGGNKRGSSGVGGCNLLL